MKITPIKTGTIHCNKTVLTYGKGFDTQIDIPSIAWLIEIRAQKMLIDTGMCDTDRAHKYHYKNSCQRDGERIDQALKKLDISVDEISIVILTHLHWDHCANLELFQNARVFVQKKELEYARNPIPPYYNSYESPLAGMIPAYANIDFELLDGDAEIIPDIAALFTPGHSPGHQSVLVEYRDTKYLIAGDACMCYENLKPNKKKHCDFTMIGRYMNVNAAWKSLERIQSVADVILPGHEVGVFDLDFSA